MTSQSKTLCLMLKKGTLRRSGLLLISLPTFAATWSGWVGLGGLSGFGLVQPLPGISDIQLDTRITLPLGSEAFMTMAMFYAISPDVPPPARRFASWSAAFAFTASLAANAGYHYLASQGVESAHWTVMVAVSSVPIMCMAAGMLLYHLTGQHSLGVQDIQTAQESKSPARLEASPAPVVQVQESKSPAPDCPDGPDVGPAPEVQESKGPASEVQRQAINRRRQTSIESSGPVLDGVVETELDSSAILSSWIDGSIDAGTAIGRLGIPRSTAYAMRKAHIAKGEMK